MCVVHKISLWVKFDGHTIIKQKLFKFLFYKDLTIKLQFFNSFSCRVFSTGEDQRSLPSASWKFAPPPSPTKKKSPKKVGPNAIETFYQ